MLRGLEDATRDTAHAISWTTTERGQLLVMDWQRVIKKVERRLEGWLARVMLRGGRMMLISALSIPIF